MTISPMNPAGASAGGQTLLNTTTSSVSASSFVQQLENALEQYMSQSGNGSGLEINIQPAGSQSSGASQFLVTVASAPAAVPSPAPVLAAPAPPAPAPAPAAPTAGSTTSATSGSALASDFVLANIGGGGVAMVPTLATEIALNDAAINSPFITPDEIVGADAGERMEPQAQQIVPGTNSKWDDLTQDQQIAYLYSSNYGLPPGVTMQQYLDANAGPARMANAPANNPYLFGNS